VIAPAPSRGAPAAGSSSAHASRADSTATSTGLAKRIYIANDDHTDYFWTATDVEYRGAFQRMIDFYLDQADATVGNPPDARGRFNLDGSLWAWEYEHYRPASDFQRLMDHVRDGTISLPLQTCVMLYGAMPAEAVLRTMYYAGRLERRFGLRFPLVVAMEDQTMPGGVASLWAGSGAKYSWKGICNCATRIDAANRPREIYDFTGPDGQSVCMKWNTWTNAGGIGGYGENHNGVAAAVDYLDTDPGFLSRWNWPVSAAFGYGADNFESEINDFVNASQSLSNASRRVIVSNEIDFFEDMLANFGNQIPSFSGSFGNEWDLYTASMGEVTADFKRHVEKLRTAEALATIASLHDPTFMNGRETARDDAFHACGLFYEHNWTGNGNVPRDVRAQFERDQLGIFSGYVDALQSDALAAVASLIAQPGTAERHLVFNPLSWSRTDFADLPVEQPGPVHVVDVSTGVEVPSEAVTVDGVDRVRILAGNVPSVGYKVYEVLPGAGQDFGLSATVTNSTVDNGIYGVSLDDGGAITSLVDHKNSDRELVAAGGALNDLGAGTGSVTVEHQGAVSTTLLADAGGFPTHQVRVTLFHGIDRVAIEDVITENFGDVRAYGSALALPGAAVHHEEVGMIARATRASAGGDYADTDTRTDYLTFNHFVDFSQSSYGVSVSNWDSPFFALGNSTTTVLDESPSFRAVAGMQVDGPSLGIPNQGGDTRFLDRFAISTHDAYDAGAAMRLALEHQNPLIAARVAGAANAPLPGSQWSLLALPTADVFLWALKPAEEGIDHGVIARVWNVGETPRNLVLSLPGSPILGARATTHIETDLGTARVVNGALIDDLARQQMRTYRILTAEAPGVGAGPTLRIALAIQPNPAPRGAATRIAYTLSDRSWVRIGIHDLTGARIADMPERVDDAGSHSFDWNGLDRHGRVARPGVYFARVEAGGLVATRRLVRL
jgi:alpha-mannosidase